MGAYQPIQMQTPQGLGGFADFLMQVAAQDKQDNARRADLLLRQQGMQNDEAHRRSLEENQRAELKLRQDTANENIAIKQLDAKKQIAAALDQGRPDLARAIGKSVGINVGELPGQDPRDTLMKPSQYERQAPEEGPQATPEIAFEAGQRRAISASFDESAAPDSTGPDGQYQAEAMNEMRRFEQAQQPSAPAPQMPMQPKGPTFAIDGESYDPEEIRRSQAAKIDQNSARFAGAMQGVEGLGKYIPVYQAGTAAGLSSEKSFELMQKRMESDEARAARDENARLQREQSDVNNRRIAGAMGNRVTHDDPFKNRTADRGDETALDTVTKNVFGQLGFKEIQVSNRKFNDMVNQLSKPNAALDAVTAGSFVKMAQGGTGVISDSDMDAFWNRIGGAKERSWQWVQNVIDGKISPEKRAIVLQGVKELAGQAASNKTEIKSALRNRLDNSAFAARANDVIGTYFPEERSAIEDSRAIDRAKNRTRSNRVLGAGRDKLDEELDGL